MQSKYKLRGACQRCRVHHQTLRSPASWSVLGTELYCTVLLSRLIRRKYIQHFRHVLQLASARQDTRCSAVSKVHVHKGTSRRLNYPRRRVQQQLYIPTRHMFLRRGMYVQLRRKPPTLIDESELQSRYIDLAS